MKVALLVLVVITGTLAATTGEVDWRIVGGANAADGQFPYQVSLRKSGEHFCGGSILDARTILSAAHCARGVTPDMVTVVTGSNTLNQGGDNYEVVSFIWHENFNFFMENDISILKLSSDIQFNENVQPVELRQTHIRSGENCTLSGWGSASVSGNMSNDLQFVNLKTITFDECKAQHDREVFESQVCTLTKSGEGSCHGDSGGPLVDADGKQIGIVSWGSPCAVGKPDVFTAVSSFLEWIRGHCN